MSEFDSLFEGLSQEEAETLASRITAAAKREREAMTAEKHQGKQAVLETQYRGEMQANRGKGFNVGQRIREKYRRMGLNVDSVSF